MTNHPTVVSDYITLMLRAIEDTQKDPAKLRSLIYDVSRVSLGKQLLSNYRELGSGGLRKYVADLEVAIKEAERLAREREKHLISTRLDVQLLGESVTASDQSSEATGKKPDGTGSGGDAAESKLPVPVRSKEVALEILAPPEPLQPIEIWSPGFGRRPHYNKPERPRKMELVVATLVGVAIYAVMFAKSDFFWRTAPSNSSVQSQGALAQTASLSPETSALSNSNMVKPTPARLANSAQDLGLPLPTAYGVYAVVGGKLYELDLLPMRIPDPRVAISAMIQNPSRVTLPNGKVDFVIFRRDLASSAPMELFVRVVARVARAMQFSDNATPKTNDIKDQWAVRNKTYEYRVTPLGDSPEMISLRPADAQLALSPGRYALVIGGQGYDFSVDGQITDTAQCLERSEVIGGAVYSECRTLPKGVM
jgi:hypothetical protein